MASRLQLTKKVSIWHAVPYRPISSPVLTESFLLCLGVSFPYSGVTRVSDTQCGNWRCHPSIFSWNNWRPFFAHRCHYHYRFLLLTLGCHPPRGCHPTTFYLFDLVSPLFLVNLPTNFFPSGITPWRVSSERSAPPPLPLVTPLSPDPARKYSLIRSKSCSW